MTLEHNNAMYRGRAGVYVKNVEDGILEIDNIKRLREREEAETRINEIGLPFWLGKVREGKASLEEKDEYRGLHIVPVWYRPFIEEIMGNEKEKEDKQ